jgi:hypothetical protein
MLMKAALFLAGLALICAGRTLNRKGLGGVETNTSLPANASVLCSKVVKEDCPNYVENLPPEMKAYGEQMCNYLEKEVQTCERKVGSKYLACYAQGYAYCSELTSQGDKWVYCLGSVDEECASPEDKELADSLCHRLEELCFISANAYDDRKLQKERLEACKELKKDHEGCMKELKPYLKCFGSSLESTADSASGDPDNWLVKLSNELDRCIEAGSSGTPAQPALGNETATEGTPQEEEPEAHARAGFWSRIQRKDNRKRHTHKKF